MQCATNTGRATHIGVANVPRVGSFLGEETRSCFIARPNRLLIGTDYSQLESRIIAHAIYLYTKHKYGKGDTRFADIIADVDDLHTYLWDDLRDLVSSRSLVKNINYAFPYGAQASKLGSLCDIKPQGMSNKQAGERILEVMQDKFPGLVETRDATMEQAKCGYVPGLDGRKIYIRSPHSAFNAKAQGWGAEVVKMGIILANQYYREESLDARQVGWYHDETQVEADAAHAEATAAATECAFHDSGTFYNLSCPMDAQAKIGTNWAETH
jgi:DNA polymerase I-like protein with 3'-5' exonuclease and polymerase domains